MKAWIYNLGDHKVQVEVEAETEEACEAYFEGNFDPEVYGLAYSPAFGFVDRSLGPFGEDVLIVENKDSILYPIEVEAVKMYRKEEPLGANWQELEPSVRSYWFQKAEGGLNGY
jgi:hypothetical protein